MTMTRDEVNALYAPFEAHEHEVREGMTAKSGKVQWFVYIAREAIIRRLDQLFPGEWGNEILSQSDTSAYSTCAMRIIIRGIGRDYNGGNSGGIGGENIPKAAATDAFKRVASMWGIGLYLQDSPQIWTDGGYKNDGRTDYKMRDAQVSEAMRKVARWISSIASPQPPQPSPAPDSGTNSDNAPQRTGGAANGGNAEVETSETEIITVVKAEKKKSQRSGKLYVELTSEDGKIAAMFGGQTKLVSNNWALDGQLEHVGQYLEYVPQDGLRVKIVWIVTERGGYWRADEVVSGQNELDAHFGERETAPMPGMPLPEDDVDFYRESE